jgi:hydroxymethylpyrimidine pyrophosphatase-like HAD family hydrolase
MTIQTSIFGQLLIEKLIRQFNEHGRLIVAFDFDDTVYPYSYPEHVVERTHELLRRCKLAGHELICFTANSDIPKITNYLQTNDIPCDAINVSSVHSEGKIFYNIFLEDKTGLDQTIEILEEFLRRTEC